MKISVNNVFRLVVEVLLGWFLAYGLMYVFVKDNMAEYSLFASLIGVLIGVLIGRLLVWILRDGFAKD